MDDRTVTVTPKDVAKFKQLYLTRTGVELDNVTATHKLHMLLRQMQVVYRPITRQQLKQLSDETGVVDETINFAPRNQ